MDRDTNISRSLGIAWLHVGFNVEFDTNDDGVYD